MSEVKIDDVLTEAKAAKAALEAQNRAFEEFKKATEQKLAEVASKGVADAVTVDKLAKIEATLADTGKIVDQFAVAMKRKQTKAENGEDDLEAKAAEWVRITTKETGKDARNFGASDMDAYKSAFLKIARVNFRPELMAGNDELKALSVGVDSQGGYFVPADMSGRMVQKVFETSPMRAYASVQVTGRDALEGFFDNDEAGYGWVGERGTRSETDTPDIGKWRIPVHEMYALPKATQQILDDAEVNIEAWLISKIADRFSRAENDAFVNGDGVTEPRGFLTYDNGTDLTNSVEQVNTGANGAFATDPDGLIKLITLQGKLKAPYRRNAAWFMNRTTEAQARTLQDNDGRFLWQPSNIVGTPSTLLGYPVVLFEDMPSYSTTGALAIAYGDMRSAYQIVDRMGIRMLRDPYSSKPYVLFYATKRVGGAVINGEAIKLLKFAN